MLRFTIRDVLWLTVVVALAMALLVQWRRSREAISRLQVILAMEEEKSDQVRFLVETSRQSNDPIERTYAARAAELEVRIRTMKANLK